MARELGRHTGRYWRGALLLAGLSGPLVCGWLDRESGFGIAVARQADRATTTPDQRARGADAGADTRPTWVDLPATERVEFSPTAAESGVPEQFRLAAHEFAYTARLEHENARVRKFAITFPSPVVTESEKNNTVHAEYFQPAGEGPKPACLVLHILGGDFLLSRTIANYLAQNGIAAMFVKLPYYGERRDPAIPRRMISRNPAEAVDGMIQGVLDLRRATAFLAARPEVDPQRLGITGISLGGIMSVVAASGEPRLKSVASYLSGGNFAEFLWSVDHPDAERFREQWTAAGKTRDDFATLVSKIDPVALAPALKNRRLLLVLARHDEVIPPDHGQALWKALGEPRRLVWLDAGHYTAARYLPLELVRIETFLKSTRP